MMQLFTAIIKLQQGEQDISFPEHFEQQAFYYEDKVKECCKELGLEWLKF